MAIFYSDTASFGDVEISGSGQGIFTISGSSGGLLSVSDITASSNIFQLTSASIDVLKVDQIKNIRISGSLIVSGSITLNGSSITSGGGGGGTPGGSTTQIQYNNAGSFGGVPYITYDGTTLIIDAGNY
jgi:phage baseplate assembly protein gpV